VVDVESEDEDPLGLLKLVEAAGRCEESEVEAEGSELVSARVLEGRTPSVELESPGAGVDRGLDRLVVC
jgi:hypothetical protein